MQAPAIPFRKMNGLGNDFVVLDARPRALALAPDAVRAIADRKEGIGCDQLIALEPSRNADVFMRIWNADGGEVGACGNAARCVAAVVAAERNAADVSIETASGVVGAVVNNDSSVTVDMGAPRLGMGRDSPRRAVPRHKADRAADRSDRRAGAAFAVGGQCRQPALPVLRR